MTNIEEHTLKDVVAYEALWLHDKASFKTIANLFAKQPGASPSRFIGKEVVDSLAPIIENILTRNTVGYPFQVMMHGNHDYPVRLRDAIEPVELLYYSGNTELLQRRSVAVIGTRYPSKEGLQRTARLVRYLVEDGFTIVSGLAKGIDAQAHQSALIAGGNTIGVIGTPLDHFYPKENTCLQTRIAKDMLLVSQVPFYKYRRQHFLGNKNFFNDRNKTVVALSEALVIVEAGERSGTLSAASAALAQGRKLFILESCFQNKNIAWPAQFEQKGAIRLKQYDDLKSRLAG